MNQKIKTCLKILIFLGFTFISFNPSQSFAADPPFSQDPGAELERFRESVELRREEFEREKEEAPTIKVEKEEAPQRAPSAFFTLTQVKITGATIFKEEDFNPIYEGYLGKKVSFADLSEITRLIKVKYHEKGYLTTIAIIPEQEIKEGVAEIRVIEGKMGEVMVEGNKWAPSWLIKRSFKTKKNEILNIKGLEQDLRRANKNPDREVKGILLPGTLPETSDLALKVKEQFPYHVGASFDNQGSRFVGKYRTFLYLRSTNFLGLDDTFFGSGMVAESSDAQTLTYQVPINDKGTKLGFDFLRFHLKLGKELEELDITGDSFIYTPSISQELYYSENFEIAMFAGLDIKSSKREQMGTLISNDRLSIPYFGFQLDGKDRWGQTSFAPQFNFGSEDLFGASSRGHALASRDGTGAPFFIYEHAVTRIQKMPWGSYASIRSKLQIADSTLPSSEQFQLGGANSVRGYPEGDFLADTGGTLSIDWIFPSYIFPPDWKLPNSKSILRRDIEVAFIYDFGAGELLETIGTERKSKSLQGIGGGIRIRLYDKISCRLEWAKAIGDEPIHGAGPSTFYLTLQGEI